MAAFGKRGIGTDGRTVPDAENKKCKGKGHREIIEASRLHTYPQAYHFKVLPLCPGKSGGGRTTYRGLYK